MKFVMEYTKIKKIIFGLFIVFISSNISYSQSVLDINYLKKIQQTQDTASSLHYFIKIEDVIQQKLDSFCSLVSQTKLSNKKGITDRNTDSGYFVFDIYLPPDKKIIQLDVRLFNSYVDYLITTNKKYSYDNLFGFTMYKQYLVLFNLKYTKYKVKDEFLLLIKDLIIPQFTAQVQKEIRQNLDEYQVITNSVRKRYTINL